MPSQPAESPREPSRWSTRDLIGPTLIFLGGFLVAAALALPTLLVPRLQVLPLSTDRTMVSTSVGSNQNRADNSGASATILDRCSLHTPTARTLRASLVRQQRVVAVQPSDGRVVTLQAGTSMQADHIWLDGRKVDPDSARPGSEPDQKDAGSSCTSPTLSAVKDRITVSRTSALPDLGANSSGMRGNSEIQYDSNTAPVQVGGRGGYSYEFPFDISRDQHSFFDPISRRTVALVYRGDTEVNGRSAARFTAEVPDTDLAATQSGAAAGVPQTQITRPASWFGVGGDASRELTATLHQSSSWELSIDTTTGTLLDQRVSIDQAYRIGGDPSLADFSLTNLHATFAWDSQTRTAMADDASRLGTPIVVWGTAVPIAAGIVGAAGIIVGILLIAPPAVLRRRLASRGAPNSYK